MAVVHDALAESYARDGFVFPIDVIGADAAAALRDDLERAEAELAGDPERLALLRSYPDRLLPSFDRLIRQPALIDAVAQVLGPDLLVWSAGLFIKDARSPHRVTWHQDLTYWGLDDAGEVTAWVALSPSTVESGCMRFVPGSHRRRQVEHVDTFADDNLLSRGQHIAVAVDDADGVDVILQPGQASLHHGHLFHASGPNRSGYRRVGAAVRYIRTSMKQRSGDRSLVTLVSGRDRYDHFSVVGSPLGRLHPADVERCRQDAAIKRRVLYEGADPSRGKRY